MSKRGAPPLTRSASRVAVRGAGFGATPRQLDKAEFGLPLPGPRDLWPGENGVRQKLLIETLAAFEEASPTAKYHALAQQNLARWSAAATASPPAGSKCAVVEVLPGDWGEVVMQMTRKYGATFAALNMANAYRPGGGYIEGMIAQEENMFRRTDCHFSLEPADMDDERDMYVEEHSDLLNAKAGRVYLDVERPRVCIRGPEDRSRSDLGYSWLAEEEVFPFLELRAAAVDLRDGSRFDPEETGRRIGAQLDTLIAHGVRHAVLSAFGCGAFRNPADQVAAIYRAQLAQRARSFDVVAFGVFHAGYGPNNFAPFERAFADWPAGAA